MSMNFDYSSFYLDATTVSQQVVTANINGGIFSLIFCLNYIPVIHRTIDRFTNDSFGNQSPIHTSSTKFVIFLYD